MPVEFCTEAGYSIVDFRDRIQVFRLKRDRKMFEMSVIHWSGADAPNRRTLDSDGVSPVFRRQNFNCEIGAKTNMKEIFSDGLFDIYVSHGLAFMNFYHLVLGENGHHQKEVFLQITMPMTPHGFSACTILRNLLWITLPGTGCLA